MSNQYCPDCYKKLREDPKHPATYICKSCHERYDVHVTLTKEDVSRIRESKLEEKAKCQE